MARRSSSMSVSPFLISLAIFLLSTLSVGAASSASSESVNQKLKKYIIRVRVPEHNSDGSLLSAGIDGADAAADRYDHEALYNSMLASSLTADTTGDGAKFTSGSSVESSRTRSRMVHTYKEVFTGFTARLTEEELKAMSSKEWFVKAIPDRRYQLLTAHSAEFLGLQPGRGLWNLSNQGEGVVIGILDTGVFADHLSFSGEGMPPPPVNWKGRCELGPSLCNNKLIGARSFIVDLYDEPPPAPTAAGKQGKVAVANTTDDFEDDFFARYDEPDYNEESPIDEDGHGTHTASTAAGALVKNAKGRGGMGGGAVGMAPRAHLAIYKVATGGSEGPDSSAVLKAMDTAVEDGVDVLSLSFGVAEGDFWDEDAAAIGAFGANAKGVFVSIAAGNGGPEGIVQNAAPWMLTVAASTTDRRMRAAVKLGNGEVLEGESLYQPSELKNFGSHMLPLYIPSMSEDPSTVSCISKTAFDYIDVRGKIVVCTEDAITTMFYYPLPELNRSEIVRKGGAAGMIYISSWETWRNTIMTSNFVLPASTVTKPNAEKIMAYFNSTDKPTATIIFNGSQMGAPRSPSIASFSARGPSKASPEILKPDIAGPGVSILAAVARKNDFGFMDGTSVACPHLSGIAALLKSVHPDWSPAMIKSAIMTTADVLDRDGKPIADDKDEGLASVYAMGAGEVNPEKAADPGLVYDCSVDEYIPYLCGLGYTDKQILTVTGRTVKCSVVKSIPERELNYPSISVKLAATGKYTIPVILSRTVTNVGKTGSTYRAEIEAPKGVNVTVTPISLSFKEARQKLIFIVAIQGRGSGHVQGYLKWISDTHVVRSPISVTFA